MKLIGDGFTGLRGFCRTRSGLWVLTARARALAMILIDALKDIGQKFR